MSEVNRNPHIVALSGSQRANSHTRDALTIALDAAAEHAATTDFVDIESLELPLFDPNDSKVGDAPELRRRVATADGVLLGSPMYHGSYASPLKTALDYCSRDEFEETTVGLLVVSGGSFPTPALEHLRAVARALDAWVLPQEVVIPDSHTAFQTGSLTDDALAERVEILGQELVEYATIDAHPEFAQRCAVTAAD